MLLQYRFRWRYRQFCVQVKQEFTAPLKEKTIVKAEESRRGEKTVISFCLARIATWSWTCVIMYKLLKLFHCDSLSNAISTKAFDSFLLAFLFASHYYLIQKFVIKYFTTAIVFRKNCNIKKTPPFETIFEHPFSRCISPFITSNMHFDPREKIHFTFQYFAMKQKSFQFPFEKLSNKILWYFLNLQYRYL